MRCDCRQILGVVLAAFTIGVTACSGAGSPTPSVTSTPTAEPSSAAVTSALTSGSAIQVPTVGTFSGTVTYTGSIPMGATVTLQSFVGEPSHGPTPQSVRKLDRVRIASSATAEATLNATFNIGEPITEGFALTIPGASPGAVVTAETYDMTTGSLVATLSGVVPSGGGATTFTSAAQPFTVTATDLYETLFVVNSSLTTPTPSPTPSVTITEFPGPAPTPASLCCIVSANGALSFGYIYENGAAYVGQITMQGVLSGVQQLPTSGTMELAAGPSGSVAYSSVNGNLVNTVGLVTSSSVTSNSVGGSECVSAIIATGSDGNLWTCGESGIGTTGQIDRVAGSGVTTFTVSASPSPVPTFEGIAPGPDGALWYVGFTGSTPIIGRITTAGAVTDYSAAAMRAGVQTPVSIVAGPDGALWFTDPNVSYSSTGRDAIGRITTGGVVTEYVLSSGSHVTYPNFITVGPDGALWFAEASVPAIGRITTSGLITQYSAGITSGAFLSGITTGPDGALWFTEQNTNKLGRLSIVP